MSTVRRHDGILDEIVPYIGSRRIFLKRDTQSYDLEVFKGADNKIRD